MGAKDGGTNCPVVLEPGQTQLSTKAWAGRGPSESLTYVPLLVVAGSPR